MSTSKPFRDRKEAGKVLGNKLRMFERRADVVVVVMPGGGVPVAFEIARTLNVAMDVFIVQNLSVPGFEELTMGAVASGGVRVLNDEVIHSWAISSEVIDAVTVLELQELDRREREYRNGRPPIDVHGKIVILTDDGLTAQTTIRVMVKALREQSPEHLVLALPAAAPETCAAFEPEVDEIVTGGTPDPFAEVGFRDENSSEISDVEIRMMLNELSHVHHDRSQINGQDSRDRA
jgi:putative phosphoribosyl transferase